VCGARAHMLFLLLLLLLFLFLLLLNDLRLRSFMLLARVTLGFMRKGFPFRKNLKLCFCFLEYGL
jgi:hypothetical protein